MYLLSNNTICEDVVRRSAVKGKYTIAIIEQGLGFRVSLISTETKTEVSMKYRSDYDEALQIAINTFNAIN